MIEIVFNELSRGSLSHAQNYGKGNYPGGYSHITYYNEDGSLMTESEAREAERAAEAKEAQNWQAAIPLGGDRDDVFDLSLRLNIGDISTWDNLDKRIESFGEYQYDRDDFSIKEFERNIQEYALENLDKIICRIKSGEKARIWYSDSAEEKLGFMWLMWNFKNNDVPLDNLLVNAGQRWRNLKPGDWYKYVDDAKRFVTQDAMDFSAQDAMLDVDAVISEWESHMKQDAKLRVIEDGKIKGVQPDYYDQLIIAEAEKLAEAPTTGKDANLTEESKPDGEFQENWLIGKLQEIEPELPEYWYYTRIEEMILKGNFVVVPPNGSANDRITDGECAACDTDQAADSGWPKSWKILRLADKCITTKSQ